jgi:hypothetical protein
MDLITIFNATVSDIRIRDFVKKYEEGEMTYPLWQRYDKWSTLYKRVFIRSLLEGKDIPKIYTCEDPEDSFKEYILDGGHRTRAIVEFIHGKFSIPLNDKNWYVFTQLEDGSTVKPVGRGSTTNQTILLPEVLQTRLLRTQLQVVSYSGLDDDTSRTIFNELNHQRAMTVPELVNMHSSRLVDGLRELAEGDIVKNLVSLVPKFKISNHEFYKPLVAMFSITERPGEEAFKYCEPASLILYVQGDGTDDDKGKQKNDAQFTEEEMDVLLPNFVESLNVFAEVLEQIQPTKINGTGDVYSLFQYVHHNQSVGVDTLSERVKTFVERVNAYKGQEKQIDKIMKHPSSSLETIRQKKIELDALREATGPHIVEWTATTQNNPCGCSNMRTRHRVLINHLQ